MAWSPASYGAVYSPPFVRKKYRNSSNKTNSHTTSTTRTSTTQDITVHLLDDDTDGGLGPLGTVNYGTGVLNVKLVDKSFASEGYKSDHENASTFETVTQSGSSTTGGGGSTAAKGGEYAQVNVSEEILAATTVSVTYATSLVGPTPRTTIFEPPAVVIDLIPYTADYIVPNSVRFTWMGHVFEDYDGVLIRDRDLDNGEQGFEAGGVDYENGTAEITDYVVDGLATDFVLNSCWTVRREWTTGSIFMRTQSAPVAPSGFVMNLSTADGDTITVTSDEDGFLIGTNIRGRIDYQTGVVEMQFGEFVTDASLTDEEKAEWWYDADEVGDVIAGQIWKPRPVDPTTLRYNTVSYLYLPLDAEILGVDPVRLPPDGRVPIFRPGGFAVVGHTATTAPATVVNDQVVDLGRVRLSRVRVVGANGVTINTGYTSDLEAGEVTFDDVTGYSQPVTIEHRIEDMVQVSDVQINGTLGFTRQLTHEFPVPGSYVSGALVSGDLRSRNSILFDQASWNGTTWLDALSGAEATGTYNNTANPVQVTNEGAVTERWALRFTSTTGGQIIGEHVGVIGLFTINADTAPINPATGTPYFTLLEAGWGTGWAVGNILRINTIGAQFPVWVVRTVQQGPEAGIDYSFTLLTRGDVDRP